MEPLLDELQYISKLVFGLLMMSVIYLLFNIYCTIRELKEIERMHKEDQEFRKHIREEHLRGDE